MKSAYAQSKTFNKLLIYFKGHNNAVLQGKNTLKINGSSFTPKKVATQLYDNKATICNAFGGDNGEELFDKLIREVGKYHGVMDTKARYECLAGAMKEELIEGILKERDLNNEAKIKERVGTLEGTLFEGLVPVGDRKTNQKHMYDPNLQRIVKYAAYSGYETWLKMQLPAVKEKQNALFQSLKIEFNPDKHAGERKIQEEGEPRPVSCLNMHDMPDWRLDESLAVDPKLPPEFKEFMEALFPNKQCIKYIFFWAYHMMTSRNTVHLLLHGARGIGKNTLVEIFYKLVGSNNCITPPVDFFDSQFNIELYQKRLVYFDEHIIQKKVNDDHFKTYSNSVMSYHAKGENRLPDEEIFASHIISNNLEVVNHLELGSRRYSMPILTTKGLIPSLGEGKVERLMELIKDKEFIGNIGYWILQNAPLNEFIAHKPYLTDLFYASVRKALFPWKSYILDVIEKKATDRIKIFDEVHRKGMTNRGIVIGRVKVAEFLSEYEDADGESFGELLQEGKSGDRYIAPSPKYMPIYEKPEVFIDEGEDNDFNNW
jgi:hypothetical protein